jgi:hypothetical protein
MDNNYQGGGIASTVCSVVFAAFAVLTLKDVQALFTIGASIVAMASGFYTIYRGIRKDKNDKK